MDASIWVAKTGLTAQQKRMTVIANNLANVNTVAFKKYRAVLRIFSIKTCASLALQRTRRQSPPPAS